MTSNTGNTISDVIISSDTEDTSDESQVLLAYNKSTISSKWKNSITVEPMLLLHFIAVYCCTVNVQSFYINAICLQQYPSNGSICSNLTAFQHEKEVVEAIASSYFSLKGLIESGVPIFYALFLGAWSDKHGSKTPLVLVIFGYTWSAFLYMIFSKVPNIHPAMILFASVPVACGGGMIALVLSVFRYISNITTSENRSFRIAIAQGAWLVGSPIGLLGSTMILEYTDYTTVFMTATVLFSLAFFYTVFIVKNDVSPDLVSISNTSVFGHMFNLSAVKETFQTCFKKRSRNERTWIMILCFNFGLINLAYGGYYVMFLYTQYVLDWNAETYSVFSTFDGVAGSVGAILGPIILINYFKLSDNVIVLMACMSYVMGASIYMMARESWMMYLASSLNMICGLATLSIRSILSKLVSSDELGKIFVFLACLEALMPAFGTFLYNSVFAESMILMFPSAVYLLSLCVYSIAFFFFVFLFFSMRRSNSDELEVLIDNS